jgi:hypothetical protein
LDAGTRAFSVDEPAGRVSSEQARNLNQIDGKLSEDVAISRVELGWRSCDPATWSISAGESTPGPVRVAVRFLDTPYGPKDPSLMTCIPHLRSCQSEPADGNTAARGLATRLRRLTPSNAQASGGKIDLGENPSVA